VSLFLLLELHAASSTSKAAFAVHLSSQSQSIQEQPLHFQIQNQAYFS